METSDTTTPALALSLFAAARAWDELAQALVNEELGEQIARPALMRLLPWLEAGPLRVTELATRADVTKQAVAQTLKGCEAHGWIEYQPDPSDGRATLVSLTRAGRQAVKRGRAVLMRIETALRDELGAPRLASLAKDLERVRQLVQAMRGA